MSKEQQGQGGTGTVLEERVKAKKPSLFKVLLHNDDYTTMEFVVWLLMEVFHHDQAGAHRIMLHVHQKGVGVAGLYPREVAEMKVHKTIQLARAHEYPLECTMEPE
jgi:ATP-dependent Clp protease adaptor protein ClpS